MDDFSPVDLRLAIVTPMADEADSCARFVDAVLAQCPGFAEARLFAVLDQVTPPSTRTRLQQLTAEHPRLKVVWAPENRHVVDAYLRGYQAAFDGGFDWILEMDAGFSHDPAEMPRFFEQLPAGHDCVFGSRNVPGGASLQTPRLRRLVSRLGTRLANLLLGTHLRDMTSGYALFNRAAVEGLLSRSFVSSGHLFQTEVRAYCRTLRCCEVPIRYRAPSSRLGLLGVLRAGIGLLRLFGRRLTGRL